MGLLPPPSENQAFINVSALESGFIEIPREWAIDTAAQGERITPPSLSFLLRHSKKPDETFLFDLGLRHDWQNISPSCVASMEYMQFKINVPQDVVESLAKGGLATDDIEHVCISHLHLDHIGDVRPFTKSIFVVGGDSRKVLENGYPKDPEAMIPSDLLPEDRTRFLPTHEWPPLGPFEHAFDFYGDGSLYIVDAGPWHVAGHVNVLARTSPDGGWVYLAGDSAHDRKLLYGEAKIPKHDIFGCAHIDPVKAAEHIKKIRKLMEEEKRVRVILAHDKPWYDENKEKDVWFPGKIESL
jgi:glyoxylase-like metal-dependent hydrolase (beta-lactamase superfamily II)